jgi:hypothetical protein
MRIITDVETKFGVDYRFDLDLSKGQVAERQLAGILKDAKVECKRDFKVATTGNLAIEFMSRGLPSGLSTSESSWWAFALSGDGYHDEVIVLIKKSRLERLVQNCRSIHGGDRDGGTKGVAEFFLFPVTRLLQTLKGVS